MLLSSSQHSIPSHFKTLFPPPTPSNSTFPTYHTTTKQRHFNSPFQKLHISRHRLLQIWKRLEVRPKRGFRLFGGVRPEVSGRDIEGVLVLEGQHAAAGVLDEDDFLGAEELLGDDEGAEGVAGVTAGCGDD